MKKGNSIPLALALTTLGWMSVSISKRLLQPQNVIRTLFFPPGNECARTWISGFGIKKSLWEVVVSMLNIVLPGLPENRELKCCWTGREQTSSLRAIASSSWLIFGSLSNQRDTVVH